MSPATGRMPPLGVCRTCRASGKADRLRRGKVGMGRKRSRRRRFRGATPLLSTSLPGGARWHPERDPSGRAANGGLRPGHDRPAAGATRGAGPIRPCRYPDSAPPVQDHLDGGEGRQRGTNLAVRWFRNVLSSVDARGDGFFERPDRALKRLGSIVPERREFWKIRGRNEYGPVVMFQRDWIRQHVLNRLLYGPHSSAGISFISPDRCQFYFTPGLS